MTQYKIKKKASGNCPCLNCGKYDDGKMHPYTLWWKLEYQKRGHQEPMCSEECCIAYVKKEQKLGFDWKPAQNKGEA